MKLNSISVKLFILMTMIVSLTVLGITMQSQSFFKSVLNEIVFDQLKSDVKSSTNSLKQVLNTYRLQLGTIMHSTGGFTKSKKANVAVASKILETSADFLGFAIIRGDNKSFVKVKKGDELSARQQEVEKTVFEHLDTATDQDLLYFKQGKSFGIPLNFDVSTKGSEKAKTMLIVKEEALSRYLSTSAVDASGLILSSGEFYTGEGNWDAGLSEAIKSKIDKSLDTFILEEGGSTYVVSYNSVQSTNLQYVQIKDTMSTFGAIDRILDRGLMWGLFFVLISLMVSFIAASTVTKKLRKLRDLTVQIANGNFIQKEESFGADEVGDLGGAVNHMSGQIQELLLQSAEKARLEGEVKTAQIVQETFFPPSMVSLPKLDLASFYVPASECGGDWWGYYSVDNIDYVYIADAVGHGVSAALLTAMAFSSLGTMAGMKGISRADQPSDILSKFNSVLYAAMESTNSMTFLVLKIDHDKREITYANAGHNFPVLIPESIDDERLRTKKPIIKGGNKGAKSLNGQGTPLGMDANSVYEDQTIPYKPGDRILLFTDGLIECTNTEGEMYGKKRALKVFAENAEENAQKIKDEIVERSLRFFKGQEMDDDMTIVVAHLK